LQYLDENPPIRQSVIDYGSGTGILAIAAVKLGANQALCGQLSAVFPRRANPNTLAKLHRMEIFFTLIFPNSVFQ
jgi:ribosomal protein L11 methyltransferase